MDRTLNTYELDSFKIRIPYDKVKIVNPSVEGGWLAVNNITGEVDPYAFKRNSYGINDNGIKTHYKVENQITGKQTTAKFLIILVNSKTLKGRYFEGITKDNIKVVYDYLISQKVVSFSYDDFLESELTDVDFKKDLVRSDIGAVITALYVSTKELQKNITKKHIKKDNKGIQWSDRRLADLSRPFFKVYHKGLELINNSTEFYEEYIHSGQDNRLRIEFTIKNKKHFRKYEVSCTSLNNVLSLSQETKQMMLEDIVTKHLDIYEVKPMKITGNLHANDKIMLSAISLIIDAEIMGFDSLVENLINSIENRSQKSLKRSELKLLWNENLKPYMKDKEKRAKMKDKIRGILFG